MTRPARLVDIPENPIPKGGEAFWFDGFDGKPLRGAVWPAPPEGARGTVLLFGGRTEFIEKYFEVISLLQGRGFGVMTMDWRGQGLSVRMTDNPLKGHIADFAQFDRDMALFMKIVAVRRSPGPLIGLAHSMGGNILMRWLYHADTGAELAVGLPELDALALTAPMMGLALSPAARLAMRVLCFSSMALGLGENYIPGGGDKDALGCHTFEGNTVTSDPDRYARNDAIVAAEPMLKLAAPTLGWGGAAVESMDWTQSDAFVSRIATPVLIAGASKDVLVDTPFLETYARRVPEASYLPCEGSRHEIMMERDALQKVFWDRFDSFVAAQV